MYKYIWVIVLFSMSSISKDSVADIFPGGSTQIEPTCYGSGDVSIQKLVLRKNEKYDFCESVTSVRIFDLVMSEGAFFTIHRNVSNFEMRIGNGIFYGRNGIISRMRDYGASGANITVSVTRTEIKFPAVSKEYLINQPYIANTSTWTDTDTIALDRAEQQSVLIRPEVGILILSIGGTGQSGAAGPSGANAIQKECTGYNGQEPTPGGRGSSGNRGGRGGIINAKFTLLSGQRQIHDLDIQLIASGGKGGFGGSGGNGGKGAPGLNCYVFGKKVGERSGFNAAPNGTPGPLGPEGVPGKIKLTVEVAKSQGKSGMFSSKAAGESKFYDDLETGECESVIAGISNGDRMIKNAITHANAWCKTGVNLGGSSNDYTAATEGTGPHWCRVKGTIQCN